LKNPALFTCISMPLGFAALNPAYEDVSGIVLLKIKMDDQLRC